MNKLIAIILLLIFPVNAQAEETDPKFFKDWLTLSDLLQTKGITPSSPSWASIIPLCLPLRTGTNQIDYNRCLYEKVMDEYQWPEDSKYCTDKAEMKYRENLAIEQTTRTVIITEPNGKRRFIEEVVPSNNLLNYPLKDRNFYYQDCMVMDMNWQNAGSWLMGHRKP